MKKQLTIILWLFLLIPICSIAQNSYIYLELLRNIPCKITVNGSDVPLMSKNFVILPCKDNYEQQIEIYFGSDMYPIHTFIVSPGKDNCLGYKLAKSGEKSFYLIDLVNNGTIVQANKGTNIALPTIDNNIKRNTTAEKWTFVKRNNKQNFVNNIFGKKKNTNSTATKSIAKPIPQTETPKYGIIEVIEAKQEKNTTPENKTVSTKIKSNTLISNKKCLRAASDAEVNSFAEKLKERKGDEAKILMYRKKQFTGCLSVDQLRILLNVLDTQSGKFDLVKITSSTLANPESIIELEDIFLNAGYKKKLIELAK